jgi:uncharacterized protein YbjT (DUF2867 family)
MGKKAIIIGSTGLVGSSLTTQIDNHQAYTKVYLVVRSKTSRSFSDKVEEIVVDFDKEETYPYLADIDDLFCCLGTTIKKAGSQENFRKVDYEYVVKTADFYQKNGAQHFLVVSAVGASEKSNIFYNRVKGEMERAVEKLGFTSVSIYRPAMLGGNREEFRFGEWIGTIILKGIQWAFFGKMKRYKIIDAKKVARSMLIGAEKHSDKITIVASEEMQNN